ncbi:MAG: fused MFS/spermidine synthase [Eggerthellaceae bacterium]|nr:fused MFS/spermidine synthase [Eggerthellaceae bacterium]MEE0343592.1 fused MFS/spermidine synthase [Eggerthellaceae bacterium]
MKNLYHKHFTQPSAVPHALNLPVTPRALGAIAAGLGLACAVAGLTIWKHLRKSDTHFVKTSAGIARIHTIEDEQGNPVRVLEQNGAYESATYLDKNYPVPVFAYQQAFDHIFEATLFDSSFANNQVLMIGGGGYAWPKHVLSTKPDLYLDVVELDQSVTDIAKKWFYLDQLLEELPHAADNLGLITADGCNYLKTTHKQYAAIINDTFSGKDPVLSLATIKAMRLAKLRLVPGGVYATNVVSQDEGEDITFLRHVVTTLNEVFNQVVIIPCEDTDFGLEDNYLVIATDAEYPFTNTMPYDDDFLSAVLRDSELL